MKCPIPPGPFSFYFDFLMPKDVPAGRFIKCPPVHPDLQLHRRNLPPHPGIPPLRGTRSILRCVQTSGTVDLHPSSGIPWFPPFNRSPVSNVMESLYPTCVGLRFCMVSDTHYNLVPQMRCSSRSSLRTSLTVEMLNRTRRL